MPAYIVECAHDALAIAHEENALTSDVEHQVIARLGHLFLASGAKPFATKDSFFFQAKDFLCVIPARGQGLLKPADGAAVVFGIHVHAVLLAAIIVQRGWRRP